MCSFKRVLFEIVLLKVHVFLSFIQLTNVYWVSSEFRALCQHWAYGDEQKSNVSSFQSQF